ncbi:MAG: NAD(+) diphosphatase [Francisellaceae bacterium]|jgi:NAD+ diphosphatase|nr:NAD(+) diphosphatase [Francisellaceae bacterium]MBT6538595.1 NAD(+) diphosphatase [Francisellaceae bacterium]
MKQIPIKNLKTYYKHNAVFFSGSNIIVEPNENRPFINFKVGLDESQSDIKEIFLDENLLFVELQSISEQCKMDIFPSKIFLRGAPNEDVIHILRGVQCLNWNRKCCYCSQCGAPINPVNNHLEKQCKPCGLSFFPNLSPAIMVLVRKENQILLARSPHFKKGMYAALAGFIDVGESAECAVHREVQEEVGLKIKSLKYFGSQSWPFPGSFMIAFTAEYLEGDIIMEPNEIEDAQWFDIHNIPDIPPMPSISRKLIDSACVLPVSM